MNFIKSIIGFVAGLVGIAYDVALAPIVNTISGKPTLVGVVRTVIWTFAGLVTLFCPAVSALAWLASALTALDFMAVQLFFLVRAIPFASTYVGAGIISAFCR